MGRMLLLPAIAFALAACQSVPENYVQFHAGTDPATVATHLAEKVGACWFDGKQRVFEPYSYAPEPGATSTRILIVPKEDPSGLPALIVEILKAKRGTDVRLFGPLMQSDSAEDLRTDIRRWTGGARDC